MITKELVDRSYQAKGLAYQRRYPNEPFVVFLAMNFFDVPIERRSEMKILEVGCGTGANLWVVAREGFDAYGIDVSPAAINLCGRVLDSWGVTADIRVGDMIDLPYDDAEFDAIYDVVSIMHLNWNDHVKCWQELYRCLKKGGRFFSYHTGENCISYKCGAPMVDHCTVSNVPSPYPLANNGNMAFLSANEVRTALTKIGFRDINIEKNTRSYENQKSYMEYLAITASK